MPAWQKAFIIAALCLVSVVGLAQSSGYDWRKDLPIQPRIKQVPRTMVFSQAQLKYGLKPYDSYYNRWTDWPLFIDPELAEPGESQSHPKRISYPDYVRRQQIVRQYGLDGFSFFVDNFPWDTSKLVYDFTDRSNVKDFLLLSIIYKYKDKGLLFEKLDAMLNCRSHLRVNGKTVIKTYGGYNLELEKALPEIRKKYGDKFIIIPSLPPYFEGCPIWQFNYRQNTITREQVEALKEHYRKYLRIYDGIYFGGLWALELDHGYRKLYLDYYRDFLLRAIKSVMAEPEFKDKYMMLAAMVGHENPWLLGYHVGSDATKTLRHSFEASLSADPDFIIIPEWDEQNENTSLRPTVYNSRSHMRIMRYYMSRIKGEPLVPLEGDNISIPNLVISTRKILSLGERLGIELLNIPDSAEEFTYTVKLLLKDIKGKVVHEFPELTFNANKMYDHTLYVPSENFADYQVLRPALEIKYKGRTLNFEDGLHYVELWPVSTYDYKWVKQPLRDLLPIKAAEFKEVKKSFIQMLLKFVSGGRLGSNGDPLVKTYS
ncbi:MAG: hypothetical protein Q7J98_08675, partial [Kiritimatiellia bacterium]|nr:hypothetical protein [Kiritimatiellia bacterium]